MASRFKREAYEKESKRHTDEGKVITERAENITKVMFPDGSNDPISPKEFSSSLSKTNMFNLMT